VSAEPSNHPVAIVVALVLAVLVGVVAIASIWANQQLLSTGSWVPVSGRRKRSPKKWCRGCARSRPNLRNG
jgi:hypothetical protein